MKQALSKTPPWLRRGSVLAAVAAALAGVSPAQESAAPILLTNVQQVVKQGAGASSSNRYEARFRAVVVYCSPATRRLYVQDGAQGLQVNVASSINLFRPGQAVEIEGKVVDGIPFPRILEATARILGEGTIPEAKPSSASILAGGVDAFRFVSLRAVVRDMTWDRNVLTLLLTEEGAGFEMVVPAPGTALPRAWLDAEVEVSGIAYPFYNSRNLPTSFRFHVPSLKFIHVTQPADPRVRGLFDRPLTTVTEASRAPAEWQGRLKITGVVTAHQPVDIVFVDDGTGPMQINLLTPLPRPEGAQGLEHDPQGWLQPGDRVEAIGVGSSRVDLQACKLEYSIVSPK